MAEVVNVIWAENEPEYFCNDHWTGQISLIRQKKLDFRRNAMDHPLPAALARADAASPDDASHPQENPAGEPCNVIV